MAKRILIVDDAAFMRMMIKDILTKKILDNCQTRLAFRTINAQDSRRILKNQQSVHERDHILVMASAIKFSRHIVYHCFVINPASPVNEIAQ